MKKSGDKMKKNIKFIEVVHKRIAAIRQYRYRAKKNHERFHEIQSEINRKIKKEYMEDDKFQWYYKHVKYSRIFTIIFNVILWFLISVFFASNPNIVFTKEHIFDRIWGDEFCGDMATVAVHIQKIRKKIEKNPSNPEFIETLWGTGYRFRD